MKLEIGNGRAAKAQTIEVDENRIYLIDRRENAESIFFGEMGVSRQEFIDATPERRADMISSAY